MRNRIRVATERKTLDRLRPTHRISNFDYTESVTFRNLHQIAILLENIPAKWSCLSLMDTFQET
ncbi:MAG: hypothetical protein F4Z14_09670 [Gammaproteobacteria bacterium]|nr:hypothetical protein [Gammaproteobacteria bacterium]